MVSATVATQIKEEFFLSTASSLEPILNELGVTDWKKERNVAVRTTYPKLKYKHIYRSNEIKL